MSLYPFYEWLDTNIAVMNIVLGKNSFFKDFMWVLFISVSLKMIFVRYSNRLVPWISSICTKVPSERRSMRVWIHLFSLLDPETGRSKGYAFIQ